MLLSPLLLLLLVLVLPFTVGLSLEYGPHGLRVEVRALGGLVRRRLRAGRESVSDAGREAAARAGRPGEVLARLKPVQRPALYLLHKTRLDRLEVEVTVGLGRADLTAEAAGGLWALGGTLAALISHLSAPGSVRPRIVVGPCYEARGLTMAVRGRVTVRVRHLLAAAWQAWWAWRSHRALRGITRYNFTAPGHIKPGRVGSVATKNTR